MINLSTNINRQLLEKFIQRKDVIFTLVVLVVAFLIGRSVSKNIYQKVVLSQGQIESQKKVNESVAELVVLRGKFDEYKKNLPEDINAFTALDRINNLARRVGIRLISVTPLEARDKMVYWEFPLNIRLEANYQDLASFVKTLEELRGFKILSLDIASGEIRQTQVLLSVNLSMLAVSLKK